MDHDVFISFASEDKEPATAVCSALEHSGIKCWIAPRDVRAGEAWGQAIASAIKSSSIFILIHSSSCNMSHQVVRQLGIAADKNIQILPVRIEDVIPSRDLQYYLSSVQWFDAFPPPLEDHLDKLIEVVQSMIPRSHIVAPKVIEAQLPKHQTKGYIFLSYVKEDFNIVHIIAEFLKKKGYAYWEYLEGDRDYHGALYQELEEKINGAAAFMCIVSDRWRASDWAASEYIYARETKIPIFVIQADELKRPMPMILNLQTRIDLTEDKEKALSILDRELKKKGL